MLACTVNQHSPQTTRVHVDLIDLNTGVLTETGSQWLSPGSTTSRPDRLSAEFTGGGGASMLLVTLSYTTGTQFAWFRCCRRSSPGQHFITEHKALLNPLIESSEAGKGCA